MKKLVVSSFIEKGTLRIRLNDTLIIDGSGDFEMDLEQDSTNLLTWFTEGSPKSHFRITVSSPLESSLQLNKVIESSGRDSGVHYIKT